MKTPKIDTLCASAMRLTAAAGFLCLAACGGGGGGGYYSAVTTTPTTPTTPASSGVGPFNLITLPAAPLMESVGASPPDFHTNGVPTGTVFPLIQSIQAITNTSVSDFNGGLSSLTLMGVKTSSGVTPTGSGTPVFLLIVPAVPGLGDSTQVPIDGSTVTLAGGGTISLTGAALNYTQLGAWYYRPTSGSAYFGTLITGFQTPDGYMPRTGGATYGVGDGVSQGIVVGAVYISDGTGSITSAALSGVVRIGVNFSTGAIGGNATGMTATPSSGGAAVGWDTLNLNATISGATFNGTSSVGNAGLGNFSLSTSATGKFTGAFYGPNGGELGAIWTLNDPGANKSAVGAIAATKLNLP